MEAQTKPNPPPYFAFKTLTNMIVKMEEHGPPNKIDRSFLDGMSGAGQTQFIAGLKSLKLIEEDGKPRPRLVEMVTDPDARPRLIGEVLRERYPEAVALGETNATTNELVDVFRTYGVQGDTARKAIAFYINAAKYAGDIPLSPHFKTPSVRTGGSSGRRRGRPKKEENGQQPQQQPPATGIPTGLHPALAGLLGDIPKRGQTWTKQQHDDFKAAFDAILKIAAPISEAGEDDGGDDFDWDGDGDGDDE